MDGKGQRRGVCKIASVAPEKMDNDSRTAEVLTTMRHYHRAMVDASIADLDGMLDDGHSLVHITGYVQPKKEWLELIGTGQFAYHGISIDENSLAVTVAGRSAAVSGRGIFDATINGMHSGWPLHFTLEFQERDGRWILMRARYTTF
jgi:hypothetical protein